MLYALMLNQCGPTTVSKDELNVQLREECAPTFLLSEALELT